MNFNTACPVWRLPSQWVWFKVEMTTTYWIDELLPNYRDERVLVKPQDGVVLWAWVFTATRKGNINDDVSAFPTIIHPPCWILLFRSLLAIQFAVNCCPVGVWHIFRFEVCASNYIEKVCEAFFWLLHPLIPIPITQVPQVLVQIRVKWVFWIKSLYHVDLMEWTVPQVTALIFRIMNRDGVIVIDTQEIECIHLSDVFFMPWWWNVTLNWSLLQTWYSCNQLRICIVGRGKWDRWFQEHIPKTLRESAI